MPQLDAVKQLKLNQAHQQDVISKAPTWYCVFIVECL